MKKYQRIPAVMAPVASLLLLFSACTTDSYEKGEGPYSLLRADYAEVHVNSAKQADYFVTDDGIQLAAVPSFSTSWMTKADTTYRSLLYYNKVEPAAQPSAEVVSAVQVPVVPVMSALDKAAPLPMDPVKFESAWLSKSGRYLNLSLYVMTGQPASEDNKHLFAVVDEAFVTNADDTKTLFVRLLHSQGGMPEYYSEQVRMSIPVAAIAADSVVLRLNSYSGMVVKRFSLR